MSLHKVVELIFTLVILLFLAIIVLGVLVGITIVQQLSYFDVGVTGQFIFVGGMFAIFMYIMKMIVDRIKDYNRYI
ncbi:hypothetical protein KKH39_03535 [Patescibacteria group bacterium]|nr:hypothetical protein [Patescibacteria group bacterium]